VDYRGLNEGTIKNRYPLPLLHETLLQLQKACYFTKLDIHGEYNLVWMAEGEEWKTAFWTRYGLFESLIMLFRLTNAPTSFQHFINDVLCPYLDVFVTAYLDNILIYSDNLEDYQRHVLKVLEALMKVGLHLKPEKCEFHRQEVKYLGFIISTTGTKMDPAKITTIQDWPQPQNVKDIQSFLGFANFYCRFIKGYSSIVAPLTYLTQKDIPFTWTSDCTYSFNNLKTAFTTAPILAHFDYDREVIVETDASEFVSARVLSQYDDNGVLYPITFFSRKHSPTECNYEIYNKELMAIVCAFKEWCPELEGALYLIQVLSDHKNLEYFMSTKLLNRQQTCWAEYLSCFNFCIVYCPGKAGGKPDTLTRRSGDLPQGGDTRLIEQQRVVLKPQNLLPDTPRTANLHLLAEAPTPDEQSSLLYSIKKATPSDPFAQRIITLLHDGKLHSKEISLSECDICGGPCENCRTVIPGVEQTFHYTKPTQCPNLTCGNRMGWRLEIKQSSFVDWQKVRVQENSGEIPTGSMP
jgi:hypothetical protein